MLKNLFLLVIVTGTLYGAYWAWNHNDELTSLVTTLTQPKKQGQILTFETSFNAQSLMQKYQKELLKDGNHTYGEAKIKFLPCYLFDVKYINPHKQTEETRLIWSLENGELILDTQTFETTHGFAECMSSRASSDDFRILNVLNQHGGSLSKEQLALNLGLDQEIAYERFEQLRKKHLISVQGDLIRIHLQTPFFKVRPETRIAHTLVMQNSTGNNLLPSLYTKEQIRKIAQAAFGSDFAIRSEHAIYVPIFQIEVLNPDGSVLKNYYNGLTGKKVDLHFLNLR